MIKELIFRFLSAFAKPLPQKDMEEDAVMFNQKESIKLRGSKAERMYAIREWSKKENIDARIAELAAKSAETYEASRKLSLAIRKSLGLPEEDPPLPDPLPKEFEGQQSSTIRAMLRQRGENNVRAFFSN